MTLSSTLTAYLIEELVQLRVGGGVQCHLKQWDEYVLQHLPKIIQQVLRSIDVTACECMKRQKCYNILHFVF